MSQTAISVGMYEEVRDYAELLDDVLVRIKCANANELSAEKQKLGQFLEDIGDPATANLTARYMGLSLNGKNRNLRRDLPNIGRKLKGIEAAKQIEMKDIRLLETLARLLDGEQMAAAARIRGGR